MVMNCTRVSRYVYCPKGLRLIGTYGSLRLTQKKAKKAEIDQTIAAPFTSRHVVVTISQRAQPSPELIKRRTAEKATRVKFATAKAQRSIHCFD
jgi:hypothetical protein